MLEKSRTVTVGDLRAVFSDAFDSESGAPAWTQAYHFHAAYEFQYVLCGEIRLQTDAGEQLLPAGTLCLVPPQLPHRFTGSADARKFHLRLSVGRVTGEPVFDTLYRTLAAVKTVCILTDPALTARFAQLAETDMWAESAVPRARTQAQLTLLLLSLCNAAGEDTPALPLPDSIADTELTDRVEQYFSAHYTQPLTLGEVAAYAGISPRQLQRVLRRSFGQSFSALLRQHRLQAAYRLITSKELSCGAAAAAVGYETYDGFFKAFTAQYGMPPAAAKNKQEKRKIL